MNEIQDKLNGLAKLGMNDTYIAEPVLTKRTRSKGVSKRKGNAPSSTNSENIPEVQLRLFN